MSRANWENRVPLLEEIIENYDQNNIITKQKQCSIKSEGYNLKNVNVYGELNQVGTPSPDAPKAIRVVGDNINVFNINSSDNINGYYYSNGTFTTPHVNLYTTELIAIPDNVDKITVSFSGYNTGMHSPAFTFWDENQNFVSGEQFYDSSIKTFTVPSGAKYFRSSYRNFCTNYKIEFGEVASNYSSYNYGSIDLSLNGVNKSIEINEFLAKIDDSEDVLDNNGVIHKVIKKVVLDGSENWSSTGNGYFTVLSDAYCLSNAELGSNIPTYLKCNRFPNASISTIYNGTGTGVGLWSISGVNRLAFYYSGKTMAEFKTWLETNPVEVYYITTVPYDVELDPAEKAKYLTLSTVSGTNNIECSAPVSFEYSKKVSEILNEVKTSYESEVS